MKAAATRGPVVIGVTGASGVVYAQRLIRWLLAHEVEVLLTVSKAGRLVIKEELAEVEDEEGLWGSTNLHLLTEYAEKDFAAPFASGSFSFHGMAVIPASMGTAGAIASGVSLNVIHRGADVAIKERRPLVIVPRETPFSTVHLENLLRLAQAGAIVLPPSPAFYQHPRSLEDLVDFVVSRVLDALGIPNDLYRRWGVSRPRRERSHPGQGRTPDVPVQPPQAGQPGGVGPVGPGGSHPGHAGGNHPDKRREPGP